MSTQAYQSRSHSRLHRRVGALLVAGILAGAPALAWAQTADTARPAQPPAKRKPPARSLQPELDESDQLAPSQITPPPARAQTPAPRANTAAHSPAAPSAAGSRSVGSRSASAGGARSIACDGVFGRDSNHLKLATAFDSRNVAFGDVDGPEGSKLQASIVFPNEPKRRLEVLWQDEEARANTALIVIGGQSQWTAPKGLRLGLTLAALEKINGKPFKLSGFDQADGAAVLDWQGGALDSLPGGCKVGIKLAPAAKTPADALAAAAGKELASNDAAVRATRPTIREIILGY
jgi:hypothetical protein